MKRTLSAFIATLMITCISLTAFAEKKYTHDSSVLPPAATVMLKKNFKSEVSLVKTEKTLGRVSEYEVILRDGTEITFDAAGNWKEIETSYKSKVPDGIVLQTIRDYIKAHQNKSAVVGIERDRKGYDVTLANGVEMEFDLNGNFVRYDK